MSDINLGGQHLNKEEREYLKDSLRYLDIDGFIKDNFYRNINFIIKMIIVNKDTFDMVLPAQHLIAYLWLLKQVAEHLKE